jgi:hypothetical protein
MIDVDQIMDTAIMAVRDVFGRPVSYSVAGTGPAIDLVAHYFREHNTFDEGTGAGVSTTRDVLDFRTADLTAAGISPRQNDVITMRDGQVWRVLDVQPGDVGSLYLYVGRRSA